MPDSVPSNVASMFENMLPGGAILYCFFSDTIWDVVDFLWNSTSVDLRDFAGTINEGGRRLWRLADLHGDD